MLIEIFLFIIIFFVCVFAVPKYISSDMNFFISLNKESLCNYENVLARLSYKQFKEDYLKNPSDYKLMFDNSQIIFIPAYNNTADPQVICFNNSLDAAMAYCLVSENEKENNVKIRSEYEKKNLERYENLKNK